MRVNNNVKVELYNREEKGSPEPIYLGIFSHKK